MCGGLKVLLGYLVCIVANAVLYLMNNFTVETSYNCNLLLSFTMLCTYVREMLDIITDMVCFIIIYITMHKNMAGNLL